MGKAPVNGSAIQLFLLLFSYMLLNNQCNGQVVPPRPMNGVRLYVNEYMSEVASFSQLPSSNLTNKLWCQSSADNASGTWFFPNGTAIQNHTNTIMRVIEEEGQIGLFTNGVMNEIEEQYWGLYICMIEDESDVTQTLAVAIFSSNFLMTEKGPTLGEPQFNLLTTRDTDPPVFTISFNATERPPTFIECFVDNSMAVNYSVARVVEFPTHPIDVYITVTFSTRQAGNYSCEVTLNDQSENLPDIITDPIVVTVPGAPFNLSVSRSMINEITLTWSPPISSPTPSGYEVFSDGIRMSEVVRDGTTVFTKTVDIFQNFTAFVVAFVEKTTSLPSERSNSAEISQGLSLTISGPTSAISYSDNAILVCEGEVFIAGLVIVSLDWFDPAGNIITENGSNSFTDDYINLNTSASLGLELRNVLLSQSGVYTCVMNFEVMGSVSKVMFNTSHDLLIQVPTPSISVDIEYITDGFAFDTEQLILLCKVILNGFDNDGTVTPNASITWTSSQTDGTILNDTNYSILMPSMDADYQINSTLIHSALNATTDNGTIYNCSVEVGASMQYNGYQFIERSTATGSSQPLHIEDLPDVEVVITVVGDPIIGDTVQLTCTSTIISDSLMLSTPDLTLRWFYDDALLQQINDTFLNISDTGDQITLTLESIDRDQNGLYACTGTLEIEGVATPITNSETYTLLAIGVPYIDIAVTGSSIANSSNYTLECRVSVDDGIPMVNWLYPMGQVVPDTSFTNNGSMSSLELVFPLLNYSSAGIYTCQAILTLDIGNFTANQSQLATVGIPPPHVSITGVNDPITEGTRRVLTCVVTPNYPLPTPLTVSIDWTRTNAAPLDIDGIRISTNLTNSFTSQLMLSPVGGADSGSYVCTVIVSTIMENVLNATGSSATNLTIQDLPVPSIQFISTRSSIIGDQLVLVCSIDTIDNLYGVAVNSSIMRNKRVFNYTESEGDSMVQVTLNPLLVADTGEYTCEVSIVESAIDLSLSSNETLTITGMVPESTVYLSITPTATGNYLEGTSVFISCLVNVSSLIVQDTETTIEWSLNGGTLTNSSNYTIYPVTKQSQTEFESTLQINQLISTDNGSAYFCIASISSNSQYLADSSNNGSVTLIVNEFTSDHVEVSLITPSTIAIAGDEVILNCSVTVPTGFLPTPTSITFSYNNIGSMSIMADNIVQSGIISGINDIAYYSTLTINPIQSSDARLYFCIAELSSFDVTASANVSLPVKIPTPVISINIDPVGSVYESTQVNLTCSVNTGNDVNTDTNTQFTWIDSGTGNEIELSDRVTVSSVNGSETSVLVFNPVDNGDNGEYNDTGSYICQVTVADDENNDLVLTAIANESYQLVVEDLPEFASPSIYYTGSDVIGETSTLLCNTTVILGLVGDTSLTWTKDNESMIQYNSTSITEATITFDPLSYNDRGRYTCRFTYLSSITNDNVSQSQTYDLNIQIPALSVVINNNQNGISYTGTVLQLDCVITLSSLVGNPINISTNWYRNGDMDILNNRISSSQLMLSDTNYTSSLSINPLNSAVDSGVYQCKVTLTENYVIPVNGSDSTDISVQALPSPNVSISSVGGQLQLGSPFALSCSVTVIDGLVVEPITYWAKRSVDNSLTEYISLNEIDDDLVSGNSTLLSYTIPDVLRTSDSGNYTCSSVLNISTIDVTASSSDSFVIPISLPRSNVSTNFSWEGNFLQISCLIQVGVYIDTPVTINVSWSLGGSGIMLSNDSRTVITEPTQVGDSNLYCSDYQLEQPGLTDNGGYMCSVTLQPLDGFIHLVNSEMGSSTTSIFILAPSEPANFRVAITTPTSLLFQWDHPLEPNGPITNYTLTIDYNNRTDVLTSTIMAKSTLEYDLDNLTPYQLITAQLAASTVAGTGPLFNITIRTQQDTPSSVTDLVASGLNATQAIISWSDVEDPNGVIIQYKVEVQELESSFSATRTLGGAELNNNVTIDGLSGETPFRVSVFAINGAVKENTSDPAQVIFFTVEGVPPPPNDISVIRVNSTHMIVSWELIPLTISRGFIEGYVITYTTQDSVNKRDATPMVNIDSTENSAVIGGLQIMTQYTVQVAATTSAGMGDFSDSIMLDNTYDLVSARVLNSFDSRVCLECSFSSFSTDNAGCTVELVSSTNTISSMETFSKPNNTNNSVEGCVYIHGLTSSELFYITVKDQRDMTREFNFSILIEPTPPTVTTPSITSNNNNTTDPIIIAVPVIVLVILLILTIVIPVLIYLNYMKRKKRQFDLRVDDNPAYTSIMMGRQPANTDRSISTEHNPAYEQVKVAKSGHYENVTAF